MAKASSISKRWLDLFKLIPGYDPVATAPAGYYFNEKVADAAVSFFAENMTHIEGAMAGQPFVLEPWQAAQVGCAFGWKHPNGLRRYREVFDFEPRKNGKSTKCGGLINLVAFCDNEPGGQIYSAAADREQAALVYRQAKGMILNKPELADQVRIYATFKSIEYPEGTVYKALSADADTKHGFNSHFIIIDELHAHYSRDLVDVLVTSTGSRRQPLIWYITTADYDRESICNEKYAYACKVRDGIIEDPGFLPVIYEAKPEDDWTSPATWRKANPNINVSVPEEYLARECKRAQETPTYENTFKRLHLNMKTQNNVAWLAMDKWDSCGVKPEEALAWRAKTLEEMRGRECYVGLDLSTTTDVTAAVLIFPGDGYAVLPFFWIPAVNAEKRERKDRVPYQTWARQGFMQMCDGDTIEYAMIRRQLNELSKTYDIREIPFDRWNATQIVQELMGDGLNMVEFGQGFASMTAPTKELEKLVLEGKIRHGGNPVLRWMASNVTVETDAAGNLKPSKKKSTEKIDGIVALVMGLGRAMVADPVGATYFRASAQI